MKRTSTIRSFSLGLALAVGLLSTSFAYAHATLVQSTPAANAVVASPQQIDLTFNETLVPRASRLELEMVHGNSTMPIEHLDIEIVNNGKTLRAKLHHPLEAGAYRVRYRAVGQDNHPMTGDFSFTVR
ncbi:MAG TPA: copper homeostasis periplasmic binding protein CopC [Xanthomonadaceae bacterium]|nr:copper homeostasis periplasmic binding protein CopC [Xanthomonadaceae bacterium]